MVILKQLLTSNIPKEYAEKIVNAVFRMFKYGLLDIDDLLIIHLYSLGLSLSETSKRLHRSINVGSYRMKRIELILSTYLGSFLFDDYIIREIVEELLENEEMAEDDIEIAYSALKKVLEEKEYETTEMYP